MATFDTEFAEPRSLEPTALVKKASRSDVILFLDTAGPSLNSFRYFKKRPFDVIDRHIATLVCFAGAVPVAYGHLDPEDNIAWLGLCVTHHLRGRGYGTLVLDALLDIVTQQRLPCVRLSVDKNNDSAMRLYQRRYFAPVADSENILIMELQR